MATDVQLNFSGFDPDETLRVVVANVAERLYFIAPSDSAMKLVVEKSKDVIRVSCRIVSQAGTFVADAIGDNPFRTLQRIEKKMRFQLDVWKAKRFGQHPEDSDLSRKALKENEHVCRPRSNIDQCNA